MFNYIDLHNIQKYIDDTKEDGIAVVDVSGNFTRVGGTTYNFITKQPGKFFITLEEDDTYRVSLAVEKSKQVNTYKLTYDENRKCSMERV